MIHLKMKNIMKSRKTTDSTRRKGRDAQADPDEDYLDQDYDDYDNEEEERIRRIKNKGLVRVSYLMVALFLSMAGYLIYFNVVLRDDINNNQYNTKQSAYQEQIIRGNIYSADGNVLAQTDIAEDGTESRSYPYSNLFAHIVGYATNGKSGIESVHNYDLLSSHASILDQIREEKLDTKVQGDSLVLTLNTQLQQVCYDALGDNKGAIVVLEPSTGKVLAMVSKPDFDPNTIAQNWDTLVNDESNSSLLNRATNGAYPPGSTFKIVTALDYFRQKGSLEGYSYLCQGSITVDDHTIQCYNGAVHGQEDFYSAFAHSCNCAFADMGLGLGGDTLKSTAEDLLFNRALPLNSYKTSRFTLDKDSPNALVMQTSIGQGNTLVSPMHMALITSAIANDGVLMKPTMIDKIVNNSGDTVRETEKTEYKRLMTRNEANILGKLMKNVVENGTASALNGRGYTVAGKTGSAEFDENGSSHSWFVGYSNVDDPDIAIAVIVENGGTGSEAAVPIAADVFDAYYFD